MRTFSIVYLPLPIYDPDWLFIASVQFLAKNGYNKEIVTAQPEEKSSRKLVEDLWKSGEGTHRILIIGSGNIRSVAFLRSLHHVISVFPIPYEPIIQADEQCRQRKMRFGEESAIIG